MNRELLVKIVLFLTIIILVLLIVFIVSRLFYLIRLNNVPKKNDIIQPIEVKNVEIIPNQINSPSCFSNFIEENDDRQTDFYKESTNYALRVIKGDEAISAEGMNDDSKQMLYFVAKQDNEERVKIYEEIKNMFNKESDMDGYFRSLNYSSSIPMWLLIIKQAMNNLSNLHFAK